METMQDFSAVLLDILFGAAALVPLMVCLYYLFLRPYRNRLSCWYMFRYSLYYRSAKNLFDELVNLHKRFDDEDVNKDNANYRLLMLLKNNPKRFVSLDQTEKRLYGKAYDDITSIDSLLQTGCFMNRGYENFTSFHGEGMCLHKIVVTFHTDEAIRLHKIDFFYHEEYKSSRSYLYQIQYYTPDDDKGKGSTVSDPAPTLECV